MKEQHLTLTVKGSREEVQKSLSAAVDNAAVATEKQELSATITISITTPDEPKDMGFKV